ncbi:CASP-like protein 1C3 [Prosopis cineraria]|uniref:CASP-like protein 1C3 n=1 Tax=Prosopis cineraria TaxID=364024 RepID=UPI00241015D7|nr:CASP-like protein 1C3 [Prosopis cineraria]
MAKTTRVCHLLLRVLAFGATLSSIIVMATSHETVSFFTVSLEAKYTHSSAFKYFVIANSVVAVYGFLVLFLPSGSSLSQFVIFFDMVFTLLLTSSVSAALAMAYVGKKGNSYAGWLPLCGQVPKFCHQVTGALASGFIALVIYIILLFHSIYSIYLFFK